MLYFMRKPDGARASTAAPECGSLVATFIDERDSESDEWQRIHQNNAAVSTEVASGTFRPPSRHSSSHF